MYTYLHHEFCSEFTNLISNLIKQIASSPLLYPKTFKSSRVKRREKKFPGKFVRPGLGFDVADSYLILDF